MSIITYDANVHHLVTAASCTHQLPLHRWVKVMHEKSASSTGADNDSTTSPIPRPLSTRDTRIWAYVPCGQSLIPTTTGSAKAITRIFPELDGKLNGHAVRVPLLNVSLTDFVFRGGAPVSVDEVNRHFRKCSEGELKGYSATRNGRWYPLTISMIHVLRSSCAVDHGD